MKVCATSITCRRPKLSAIAPAVSENSITGSAVEAWTSATMSDDEEIEVISQAAPTPWIRPPKLENRLAVQTARKVPCRNGARVEPCSLAGSSAEDIVYSNLFTGVHGNYLKPSIVAAGMDPDNLPVSDPSKMNFGTDANGERPKPKAWKEIWGSGQGIGSIDKVVPAAELIGRLKREYDEAVDPPL